MCQTCVDDGLLSQATYDKLEAFADKYPDSRWGPAHIVIEDANVNDHHIKWCLGLIRAALSRNPADLYEAGDVGFMGRMAWYEEQDKEELKATAVLLEELLTIPAEAR